MHAREAAGQDPAFVAGNDHDREGEGRTVQGRGG
jgi:hypothetical protein